MARVERLWTGSTVVCLGGGPSLTAEDVDFCRGKARVIAVNDAYRLAPWADALYACDVTWWQRHQGVPSFTGPKWSLAQPNWGAWHDRWPEIQRLKNGGADGLSLDQSELRTGKNSGYQAINLAVLYGASRIVLLGYDMQSRGRQTHWHERAAEPPYAVFLPRFLTLVEPLNAAGVEIVNCSPETALKCFPRADLRSVLANAAVAA